MKSRKFTSLIRLGLAAMLTTGGVSCAVTETAPAPVPVTVAETNDIDVAWEAYSRRNYESAMQAFDAVAANNAANTDQRRQALLGKAMIYLSTSPEWRNLDHARDEIQQAAEIAAGGSHSADVNFFGSAVEGHFNAESDNAELNAKVNEALRELEKVKASLASAEAQNQSYEVELETLNTALEKMKELTLGN